MVTNSDCMAIGSYGIVMLEQWYDNFSVSPIKLNKHHELSYTYFLLALNLHTVCPAKHGIFSLLSWRIKKVLTFSNKKLKKPRTLYAMEYNKVETIYNDS